MARIKLGRPATQRALRLDDSPHTTEIGDQLPEIELVRRTVVGRDADGSRVWGWETFATTIAVSYEERRHTSDDLIVLRVRAVVLFDGDLPDPTEVGFKISTVAGDEAVYRLSAHEWNGFRLQLEGERVV